MKILIIYTGGTIGMVKYKDSAALKPGAVDGVKTFLRKEVSDESFDLITTKSLIDSSDFNKKHYKELSVIIKENYLLYDSFLVLMGTDTMAYLSSLLSFCTSGLSKPILFTGGQKTLYEQNSDSISNLKGAINGLLKSKFPKEVGIYFAEKWHRAVCTTKYHTHEFDAYVSVTNNSNRVKLDEKFNIITDVFSNVCIIKMTPFDDESILDTLLDNKKINAIVLEIFGSGNMPKLSTILKQKFKRRVKEGLKVVVTSQCMYGGLEIGRYQSSLNISSLGFLNAGKMTKESIVGKIMYLVEKKLNIQEFKAMFEDSIRGEY